MIVQSFTAELLRYFRLKWWTNWLTSPSPRATLLTRLKMKTQTNKQTKGSRKKSDISGVKPLSDSCTCFFLNYCKLEDSLRSEEVRTLVRVLVDFVGGKNQQTGYCRNHIVWCHVVFLQVIKGLIALMWLHKPKSESMPRFLTQH